jgi:hypothetical protein
MSAKRKPSPPPTPAEYDGLIARVNGLPGITAAVNGPFEDKARMNVEALRRWCGERQGKPITDVTDQPVSDNQRALEY